LRHQAQKIHIEGDGAKRSITNNGNNALFTIPDGTELILNNNITLRGNGKTAPVVEIETGGTLTMNSGVQPLPARKCGGYILTAVLLIWQAVQ
jgi:hypothetical protein